ncbi:M50 family metallopeptidase [uncultured Fusobacterium sp.]|jgi:regulator of sigma E protease|uniref:M50 family metallopeptidase n=1 Tax=uncultured Fusobacterium sp. TaxID=159267 RepID=UPI0025D3698A|nr:M50 family metallopeptidase [uncultured Fusobacterium sp.]MCF2640568.1 site-2 protease family protein [Fusobacterium varium]
MNIIAAIIVLGIIIFIHELGHFVTAKFFKMPVSEFSIGMGPQVYSYDTINTTYSFRAIPLGGFVNIEGMEVDSKVEDGFNSKSPFARLVVLFAGVFMNFLLAFSIIFIMLNINGKAVQSKEAIVGHVLEKSNGSKVLLPKDKILSINGVNINNWDDISKTVSGLEKKDEIKLVIERDNEKKDVDLKLTYEPETKRYILGILPDYHIEKFTLGESIKASFLGLKKIMVDTLDGLKMVISGKVKSEEISGPIGIIKVVGEASKEGIGILAWLTALLSVNVGILNLLPLPALDGGRIIFVLLELVGIKVNKKIEERIHAAGMMLLFALFVYISANDIFNLTK